MGNSEIVMQKHALRETDDLFNRTLDDGLGSREGKLGENERNSGKEKALFPVVCGKQGQQSTPQRIRTSNLRFRRPMLYPIELGVRVFEAKNISSCWENVKSKIDE